MIIKVEGVKETIVRLNNLTLLNQHRIMGSVIYKSSKPMEDEQKRQLQSKTSTINPTTKKPNTGNLLRSIGRKRVAFSKAREIGTVRVGPRIGAGYKGHHAHLLEFGHRKVLWGRRTNERVKAYSFIEPAYRVKMPEVRAGFARNLNYVLNRWKKTGRISVNYA